MSIDIKKLFSSMEDSVKQLAISKFSECEDAAFSDGQAFIEANRDDLRKWAQQLADGGIDKDDLEWNMKSLGNVAELAALKQAGLAAVKRDEFRQGLLGILGSTISKLI